jgi:hypothetical protein
MDNRAKRYIFQENKNLCNYKHLKDVPFLQVKKYTYNESFEIPESVIFGTVEIIQCHSLTIAKKFIELGHKPVIISYINNDFDKEFIDSCNEIYDEQIAYRTNYYKTFVNNSSKINIDESIYSEIVHIFRNEQFDILDISKTFCTSFITLPFVPIEGDNYIKKVNNETLQFKLLNNPEDSNAHNKYSNNSSLKLNDYLIVQKQLETAFQMANILKHDSIIITPMCYYMNYPIDDFINILNGCILKYGCLFKYIIISIPKYGILDTDKYYIKHKNMGDLDDMIYEFECKILKPHIILSK